MKRYGIACEILSTKLNKTGGLFIMKNSTGVVPNFCTPEEIEVHRKIENYITQIKSYYLGNRLDICRSKLYKLFEIIKDLPESYYPLHDFMDFENNKPKRIPIDKIYDIITLIDSFYDGVLSYDTKAEAKEGLENHLTASMIYFLSENKSIFSIYDLEEKRTIKML